MKVLLKRIIRGKEVPASKKYFDSGNIKVGKNSNIQNLHIEIFHADSNCYNIIIGDDCNLSGSLTIYSSKGKIIIGDRVFIGPNTKLICYNNVTIDDDVMVSWGCTIMDTNAHSLKSAERMRDVVAWNKGWEYKDWSVVECKPIIVGKKSWIGFNSIVLKGVTLGEGTVVASGSVVTKSTDEYVIIGGNPAKFIKKTE